MDVFEEIQDFLERPPSQLAQERLTICHKCEHYNPWGICNKCGCILAIKARIPQMKCPVGKW